VNGILQEEKEFKMTNPHTGNGSLERAIAKIGSALGVVATNTEEAVASHKTEVAFRCETERYSRAVLDLQSEFALRQDQLRRYHLRRMAEISDLGE
jgi:hypothetical protein